MSPSSPPGAVGAVVELRASPPLDLGAASALPAPESWAESPDAAVDWSTSWWRLPRAARPTTPASTATSAAAPSHAGTRRGALLRERPGGWAAGEGPGGRAGSPVPLAAHGAGDGDGVWPESG